MTKEEFEEMIGIKVSSEMYYGIVEPMYRAVPALREKGLCMLLSTEGIKTLDETMLKIEKLEIPEWDGKTNFDSDDNCGDINVSSNFFDQEELDRLFYETPLDLDEAMKELERRNDLPF